MPAWTATYVGYRAASEGESTPGISVNSRHACATRDHRTLPDRARHHEGMAKSVTEFSPLGGAEAAPNYNLDIRRRQTACCLMLRPCHGSWCPCDGYTQVKTLRGPDIRLILALARLGIG